MDYTTLMVKKPSALNEETIAVTSLHEVLQEKHNEISELKPLLTTETVKGRILSLDALHTQRDFCTQVQRLEGDYVLIAKDNQHTLEEDRESKTASTLPYFSPSLSSVSINL